MKQLLFCTGIVLAACLTSCSETNKTDNSTNNADTAVLVNDPANTMNANPVNDTTVTDTTVRTNP